jgi:hypothetical protein
MPPRPFQPNFQDPQPIGAPMNTHLKFLLEILWILDT